MTQQSSVWIAYASTEQQIVIEIPYVDGMTAREAIVRSGITQRINLPEPLQVGVFSQKVDLDDVLAIGDRVEIYRPLTINPKDIRRKRAAQNPVGRYLKSKRLRQLSS